MHFGLLLLRQLVAASVRVRRVVRCLVPHGQTRHAVHIGDIMRRNIDFIRRLRRCRNNLRQPTLIRVTQRQTLGLAPVAEMNNGCLKTAFERCSILPDIFYSHYSVWHFASASPTPIRHVQSHCPFSPCRHGRRTARPNSSNPNETQQFFPKP